MGLMKGVLAVALLVAVPAAALAGDEATYAAREAAAPGLAEFVGGCPGPDGLQLVLMLILAVPFAPFLLLAFAMGCFR